MNKTMIFTLVELNSNGGGKTTAINLSKYIFVYARRCQGVKGKSGQSEGSVYKDTHIRSSLVTQQLRVTREPLSLLSVLSLLWHGFGPWPGKFHMRWTQPGEKKKKKIRHLLTSPVSCPHTHSSVQIHRHITSSHLLFPLLGTPPPFLKRLL